VNTSPKKFARLAGLLSGAVFGIYWLPLRQIELAGFEGPWATFLFNLLPAIIALFLVIKTRSDFALRRRRFHLGGVLVGFALVLYATSFLYTEVVRTQLLFYVTPLWGFLLALVGLLVILKIDSGFPWPGNLGDWLALIAGVVWACGSLVLNTDNESHPNSYCLAFFLWGAVFAFAIAYVMSSVGMVAPPSFTEITKLWWFALFALLVAVPAGWATVYAAQNLNPGVVGLLFMAEISVATVTASIIAGEPFGLRELAGVVLITLAGVLEPVTELRQQRKRSAA